MSRELLGRKDPIGKLVRPHADDSYAEKWELMSRFEKLCWLGAADNRFIRKRVVHVVKFERLLEDHDYFREMILDFLGLDMPMKDWHDRARVTNNATPRYTFPAYSDWTATEKRAFDSICSEEMAVYGY